MRRGGVPLAAFLAVTIVGQLFEVDEEPLGQLLVLGGSTVLAVTVSWFYSKRTFTWCRYLCPVSLLFGVFSRLGALHFAVDRRRLENRVGCRGQSAQGPCPVGIHLPVMNTNRYCLTCFRCAGFHDAIHLALRRPGEELERIDNADPLFWEVMFLFGGAIGLPLGVFWAERAHWSGLHLVACLIGATLAGLAALSAVVVIAVLLLGIQRQNRAERFTAFGYVFTPVSLFSLFLGLSQPTFQYLAQIGMPSRLEVCVRAVCLLIGCVWSLTLIQKLPEFRGGRSIRTFAAFGCLAGGILTVAAVWAGVIG